MTSRGLVLVDDHRLLAQSMSIALAGVTDHVVLVDPSIRPVLDAVRDVPASVVLLDLDLGGGLRGDELIADLVTMGHRVVVLTADTDAARWWECVRAGALGVVAKSAPLEEVVEAARRALAGEAVVAEHKRLEWLQEWTARQADEDRRMKPFRRLTAREQEVLASLAEGRAAAEIAADFVVSEATVRTQIRAVLTKLDVSSQLQAVARARNAGWKVPAPRRPHDDRMGMPRR